MGRKNNDVNILCLGRKTKEIYKALQIIDSFFEKEFEGGRQKSY
jgi:ribose 5-phosphate isomerase RpiB